MRELPPLFEKHWRELALNKKAIRLDPNYENYCQYDAANILRVLTVRTHGVLVGYAFLIIGPHMHYKSTSWCHIDMFYLEQAHRKGWIGVRMFREIEEHARAAGAQVIYAVEKLHWKNRHGKPLGRLFKYLRFKPVERVYSKFIG